MKFYEITFIVRHDASSSEIDKRVNTFSQIIHDHGGSILKTEYWGLRNLAYEINNNKKGHYCFLGVQCNPDALNEMKRRMKLSEDIIRSLTVKVDAISNEPSPILQDKGYDNEETIDVTV